jgi:hypothetical protein
MAPAVIGCAQISAATNCDAPANMSALISAASAGVSPLCAANTPNAALKRAITGIAGIASFTPRRTPAAVQRGGWSRWLIA